MAAILVVSEGDGTTAEIQPIPGSEEGGVQYRCRGCGEVDTDRGHFGDTVRAAEMHVDYHCPRTATEE